MIISCMLKCSHKLQSSSSSALFLESVICLQMSEHHLITNLFDSLISYYVQRESSYKCTCQCFESMEMQTVNV